MIEPSLMCDECDGQIMPGENYYRLQLKELVRIETPTYVDPYDNGKNVDDSEYVHEECLERPSNVVMIVDEAEDAGVLDRWVVKDFQITTDRNFPLDSNVDWDKLVKINWDHIPSSTASAI